MFWRMFGHGVARTMARNEGQPRLFFLLPLSTLTNRCLSIRRLQCSTTPSPFLTSSVSTSNCYPTGVSFGSSLAAPNAYRTSMDATSCLATTRDYEASLALSRALANQAPRLPDSLLVSVSGWKFGPRT